MPRPTVAARGYLIFQSRSGVTAKTRADVRVGVFLVKTTRSHRISDLPETSTCRNPVRLLAIDRVAPASPPLGGQCFQVARRSHLRKPRSATATVGSARQATSPSAHFLAKAVLGGVAKLWAKWEKALILVTPGTVVEWHRAGFRLYWRWVARAKSLVESPSARQHAL
jgi:hypothetical protein